MMRAIVVALVSMPGMLRGVETIEFAGYVFSQDRPMFVLKDVVSRERSRLLLAGESFRGYTVRSFDPREERVILEKDGVTTALFLEKSRIVRGKENALRDDPDWHPDNRVTVTGAVREQGSMKPTKSSTVEDALAAMGGLTADAMRTVFIARQIVSPRRSPGLTFLNIDLDQPESLKTKLMPGDVIHIPKTKEP